MEYIYIYRPAGHVRYGLKQFISLPNGPDNHKQRRFSKLPPVSIIRMCKLEFFLENERL